MQGESRLVPGHESAPGKPLIITVPPVGRGFCRCLTATESGTGYPHRVWGKRLSSQRGPPEARPGKRGGHYTQ